MKFIIDGPEGYFPDAGVEELVLEDEESFPLLNSSLTDQEITDRLITVIKGRKGSQCNPILGKLIISDKGDMAWDKEKGSYSKPFRTARVPYTYVESHKIVELESLEDLDKLSLQVGHPIVINLLSPRIKYPYPSIHVYDDYIE